ncbi:hypothetical protein [Roseomonas indoligenes]|uniref:Uncharacterized protein n=1 Tax=Roseomonas indoligenes TaxID=2820811 RepID=A0A940MVW9_9PROT|nr:hypothetical protein [Pararoseomonas indoligenes]MBP0492197.1 hypothetical protein [Pararoseomonas indoligenes]
MTEDAQALTSGDLRNRLSHACEMAGGQSRWAQRHNIPVSVVSETISGRRDPSERVINALGLMRVERFIPFKRGSNG